MKTKEDIVKLNVLFCMAGHAESILPGYSGTMIHSDLADPLVIPTVLTVCDWILAEQKENPISELASKIEEVMKKFSHYEEFYKLIENIILKTTTEKQKDED